MKSPTIRTPWFGPLGTCRTLGMHRWQGLLLGIFLAGVTIPIAVADTPTDRLLLPIEVLGADGTVESRRFTLQPGQAESVKSLWLQVHGVRYAEQASVQVNTSRWIPLDNNTVTVAAPGSTFGGIGGGFATLVLTLRLPTDAVLAGSNAIRFRFNHTDGLASGYRVLAWNLLTADGSKVLPPSDFAEDVPESWTPPRADPASINAGRELWLTASLLASSLPNSPRIVARSHFHGLTTLQGEQIASYIRSLPLPSPGRPWNPPYQPGPGLDKQPVWAWAAGAGLEWVLPNDHDTL